MNRELIVRRVCPSTAVALLFLVVFLLPMPAFAAELITNGSFSSGTSGWTLGGDFWAGTTFTNYRTSPGYAAGGVDSSGYPKNNAYGYMYQKITIPSNASSATLSFWYNITSNETVTTAYDYLKVYIQNSSGSNLATVAEYSNVNKAAGAGSSYYSQKTFDLTSYIRTDSPYIFSCNIG